MQQDKQQKMEKRISNFYCEWLNGDFGFDFNAFLVDKVKSEISLAVSEREKELVKKLPLQRITQLPDDVGSPHETEFDRGWNSYRAEVLSLITKEK